MRRLLNAGRLIQVLFDAPNASTLRPTRSRGTIIHAGLSQRFLINLTMLGKGLEKMRKNERETMCETPGHRTPMSYIIGEQSPMPFRLSQIIWPR